MGTSELSASSRGRRLALGAAAAVIVGLVSAYATTTGAQPATDPIAVELVSVDGDGAAQELPDAATPAISDTGAVIAYDTAGSVVDSLPTRRVWIRDRIGATSRPVGDANSAAPGISGNGCIVAYSVVRSASVERSAVVELTVVDRCATPIGSPLPPGAMVDTVAVDTAPSDPGQLSAPALSFDGSTIVWSTGSEVRRYVRPTAGGTHQRAQSFDVVVGGDPATVTGVDVDVSSDGATTVFVAGPGTGSYEPAPGNVYVWSAASPQLAPTLLSVRASGEPGTADSTSPTISADGSFVVFETLESQLAVADSTGLIPPFVVGADLTSRTSQILVDEATRPAVSADGNHVLYQRGDAVRVLSSDATSTVDVAIPELATARPTGRLSISQFGRWIVFPSRSDLSSELDSAPSGVAPSVWAIDRRSSAIDVVDTTTTTTTTTTTSPTTTATTAPAAPTTTAPSDVASLPTVPASTLVPTVVFPRFPTTGSTFPRVVLPSTPRSTASSTTSRSFDPGVGFDTDPFASPVIFEPTVVGAGRRTAPVTLTNPTTSAVRVSSISVDVPGVFTLVTDGCSGIAIAPNASCVVEVQFSPVTLGLSIGSTTFQLLDDSVVTASIEGEGVGAPTLDLVPSVAGAGQTVTVFGAGFVGGSTVQLNQPGVAVSEPVAVEADGTFAQVIVVLPNTPTGPARVTVDGQPDVFDDVIAELLVSSRGSTSADAALRTGSVGAFGR